MGARSPPSVGVSEVLWKDAGSVRNQTVRAVQFFGRGLVLELSHIRMRVRMCADRYQTRIHHRPDLIPVKWIARPSRKAVGILYRTAREIEGERDLLLSHQRESIHKDVIVSVVEGENEEPIELASLLDA